MSTKKRVCVIRVHQTRNVPNCGDCASGRADRPPRGPQQIHIRQQDPVACQREEPVRPAPLVDFLKNGLPHELRDRCGLFGSQVRAEDAAICQHRIEVIDERAVLAVGAPQIITPRLQAKWQKVGEEWALDFLVEQILSVFLKVAVGSPHAVAQSNEAVQMPVVEFVSLLRDLFGRLYLPKARYSDVQ